MSDKLLDNLLGNILKSDDMPFSDKQALTRVVEQLNNTKLNIMLVGATGVGKSSTINAIFDTEVAKVGYSVDPETSHIQKYEIGNIVLWDTPGLGDSPDNDRKYAKEIIKALREVDSQGNLLIDEVVVLIDGSSRDLKTTYETIENVIAPYIGDEKRILLAINQCDVGMKGRYWNNTTNRPEEQLVRFMDEKVLSVQKRVYESTGINTTPMYYSALCKYNISKLLLAMMKHVPATKRFIYAGNLNKDPEIWKANDEIADYNREIQEEVKGSLTKALDGAAKGAAAGATVGALIPFIGAPVGAAIGATLGFLGGLFGI